MVFLLLGTGYFELENRFAGIEIFRGLVKRGTLRIPLDSGAYIVKVGDYQEKVIL